METAPLTLAHAHARNASAENWKANSSQASDEHQQAAGEFAKAAKGTKDLEAFRVLKLLESHHERLASIIKCNHASPAPTDHATDSHPSTASTARPSSPRRPPQSPPRTTPRRKPPRDLSSSIASNLASARGIPGSQRRPAAPAISAQHVDGRILNRTERATPQDFRKDGPQQAKTPVEAGAPEDADEKESAEYAGKSNSTDDGFKRFFSTFETFYSALSAPLAFAGLPLMAEEPGEASVSEKPTPKSTGKAPAQSTSNGASAKADTVPDPSTLFSKATLRALDTTGAAESFIVVPTTGGTVSYAGILNHSGNQTHGGVPSPIIEEEERSFDGEEFVDANEEPAPPSPTTTRSGRRARPGSAGSLAAATEYGKGATTGAGGRKTMEELELENGMMRQLLDKLSKRLHMWEASSQSQSLALAQSFRAHRPPVGSGPGSNPQTPGQAADQSNMEQRLRELEILVESLAREKELLERENDKVARENEKLLSVLGRYREKWEVLKAGARGRRERGAGGASGTGAETSSGAGEARNAGGSEADKVEV
ncbi:hypothetical protein MPH_04408 [Macrophomina phaseolina MS6]|uniref:Uncharacterized protein n=1 Tax=Macrophomina phaseolina (strain MS6) TaxID=1126212 RepID=K2R7H3_MACPH|nr:hypothetical protein MPH_04408 [Macrophomina phaseolina MS6]